MIHTKTARRGRPTLAQPSICIPVLLRLRPEEDADLIQFFDSLPPRRRAVMLKSALRGGIQNFSDAGVTSETDLQDLTDNLLV